MDWLNYHHLHYFWMVAKEGSMTAAAAQLHLAQPTLSTQIQKLERSLGAKLFERKGRAMVLTEAGHTVYRYADEIFALGRELGHVVRGGESDGSTRLLVGVPDAVPKLIVYQLLKPALELDGAIKLVVYEGKLDALIGDLAVHRLDIVLANTPLTPQIHVRAFNHLLGECSVTVLGTSLLARRFRDKFPQCLDGAPMLLPTQNTTMRRALEQWFDERQLRPNIVHEFEDSAVMKVFGQAGEGLIVVPSAIEEQVAAQFDLKKVGRIEQVVERFYAISVERRLKHPAVVAISEAARKRLFA